MLNSLRNIFKTAKERKESFKQEEERRRYPTFTLVKELSEKYKYKKDKIKIEGSVDKWNASIKITFDTLKGLVSFQCLHDRGSFSNSLRVKNVDEYDILIDNESSLIINFLLENNEKFNSLYCRQIITCKENFKDFIFEQEQKKDREKLKNK